MDTFVVQLAASHRISEIYQYTLNNFGQKQAIKTIEGLFNSFSKIKIKSSTLGQFQHNLRLKDFIININSILFTGNI